MKIWINDQFFSQEKAYISVLDRGFLFGDGIYEMIGYQNGWMGLDYHINRLFSSAQKIGLNIETLQAIDWRKICHLVLDHNPDYQDDGYFGVYIQVTRGVGDKRKQPPDRHLKPTIVVMPQFVSSAKIKAWQTYGMNTITAPDIRWQLGSIKSISLLAQTLYKRKTGTWIGEVILLREGHLTEGSTCNVLIVEKGKVVTPGQKSNILMGVTRRIIQEALAFENISFVEDDTITMDRILAADEVWISLSSAGIVPIRSVDGKAIGNAKPGALFSKTLDLYSQRCKQLMEID